ncbi:hypothetical protein PLESTM_001240900 [Pleodorina starrii]|nr:hypothetical protein PLESTM_001240900 [Pleodorina starrii]
MGHRNNISGGDLHHHHTHLPPSIGAGGSSYPSSSPSRCLSSRSGGQPGLPPCSPSSSPAPLPSRWRLWPLLVTSLMAVALLQGMLWVRTRELGDLRAEVAGAVVEALRERELQAGRDEVQVQVQVQVGALQPLLAAAGGGGGGGAVRPVGRMVNPAGSSNLQQQGQQGQQPLLMGLEMRLPPRLILSAFCQSATAVVLAGGRPAAPAATAATAAAAAATSSPSRMAAAVRRLCAQAAREAGLIGGGDGDGEGGGVAADRGLGEDGGGGGGGHAAMGASSAGPPLPTATATGAVATRDRGTGAAAATSETTTATAGGAMPSASTYPSASAEDAASASASEPAGGASGAGAGREGRRVGGRRGQAPAGRGGGMEGVARAGGGGGGGGGVRGGGGGGESGGEEALQDWSGVQSRAAHDGSNGVAAADGSGGGGGGGGSGGGVWEGGPLIFVGIFTTHNPGGLPAADRKYDYALRRAAVRATWLGEHLRRGASAGGGGNGGNGEEVVVRFVAGEAGGDSAAEAALGREAEAHGDFLRLPGLQECYSCLTNKTRAFFAAALAAFPSVRWLVKADDDVYLIPHRLPAAAEQWERIGAGYIGCMKHGKVYSEEGTRWYEPLHLLLGPTYYLHAYGSAYVLSAEAARRVIVRNYHNLRLLRNEDTAVGAWMLAHDVVYFEDMRLCSPECHKAAMVVARTECAGLCAPLEDLYALHRNESCQAPHTSPLPYMPSYPEHVAFEKLWV